MINKKGQVTIFIIVGILLVALVAGFFIFRGNFSVLRISPNLEPAYNNLLSCLEDDTLSGVNILESQAGYIYLPDFESGSNYMPFSSELDFLGNPIPYWYYVSGNGIQREQAPSKSEMEAQLERYIEEKISFCNFKNFYEQGFKVSMDDGKANVNINKNDIEVSLSMNMLLEKGEDNANIKKHEIRVKTDLGKLYDSAKKIYNYEQKELFLEDYGVDILRLYAPVDGVEVRCSPKIWNAQDVFDDLKFAIEINTLALKTSGNKNDYFLVDVSVDEEVRFINSMQWKYAMEVEPVDGNLLISNPVGNQPGLGILGFCYVPYHFVYDLKYPVLVQVLTEDETFQFPMAVVIRGNQPREPLDTGAVDSELPELCNYKNTPSTVRVQNTQGSPVDAFISYECLGTKCNIGETKDGNLNAEFPQCINGYVIAKAEGYESGRAIFSSMSSGTSTIILDRIYEIPISLKLNGENYNGNSIITFTSEKGSRTISYPEQTTIELSEGQYEINVDIYKDKEIKLSSSVKEQCVDVPQNGIGALFGLTKKKCFDIEIPEQIVSQVLIGGGTQQHYILESELKNSNSIEIYAEKIKEPVTIEDLQENYILLESKGLVVNFK